MFRRLGRVVHNSRRANTALRTPIEAFRNPEFVNTQISSTLYLQQNLIPFVFFHVELLKPDPFRTEKLVIEAPGSTSGIKLITRSALHGDYCTIGVIIPTGSRHAINMPSGKFFLS